MSKPKERGFLLIAAIVLLVILSFFALVVTILYVGDTRRSIDHLSSAQALFLAESGLERGTHALLSPTVMTPSSTDNRQSCQTVATNLTGVGQGAGLFSVTGGTPFYSGDVTNSAVEVKGALSAIATLIPLTNTAALADYAPSGRVLIDQEQIDYSAISSSSATCGGSAPCLIGVIRGVDGTLPAAHAAGTPVAQYQCVIQSKGGVASFTNPRGQRTLSDGIQLQEAWAVGSEGNSWQTGGSVTTLLRWTGSAWTDASAGIASRNLNAITCINYADCWAVGSANLLRTIYGGGGPTPVATVAHWNGSSWTNFSGTLPGSVKGGDLDTVTCTSHDNCWMVGSYSLYNGIGNKCNCWTLVHMYGWSGTTPLFRAYQPKDLRPKQPNGTWDNYDIDSVACMNANECLAVGSYTQNFPLVLEWNGAYWTMLSAPGWMGGHDLDGVTCTTSECWVVGSTATGQALVAKWTPPNSWTAYPVANASDVEYVTCVSTDECWAVGSWDGPYAVDGTTTLLYWNGASWTNVTSQLPATVANHDLDGIACGAPDDCWAVGGIWGPYLTGTNGLVALHWDGSSWTDFSASMPNGNDVEGIALTGPGARPRSAWQEVFP